MGTKASVTGVIARQRKLKLETFEAYGGAVCVRLGCGVSNPDILTLDHIDGGGAEHRRAEGVGTGVHFYRWLRDQGYPPGFRVLCINHNVAEHMGGKGLETRRQKYNRRLKTTTFEAYGGCVCVGCGVIELSCLTIHHVNGGGNRHRRETGIWSGEQTYRWLRDRGYPPGFQVLCFNCNWLKYLNGR